MGELKKIGIRILLFSSPFLLIIGSYLLLDPFKVLFDYSLIEPSYKNVVTDYMRTEELLDNYSKEKYNTFTLGNSQIQAFREVYPEKIKNASFADLHNPGESIWNVYNKIKLIDSLGLDLDHILLIMNAPLIENVRNTNPAYVGTKYIHHPLTSGGTYMDFHKDCFGFYLADMYFIKYLDYNIFKHYRPYMEGVIPRGTALYEKEGHTSARETIQDSLPISWHYIDKVEKHPVLHLDNGDRDLLYEIRRILDEHNTKFCLIIPPNKEVSKIDLTVLREFQTIFDEQHVFDFSGKNRVIFSDEEFIDDVHFKPIVAGRILEEIGAKGFDF